VSLASITLSLPEIERACVSSPAITSRAIIGVIAARGRPLTYDAANNNEALYCRRIPARILSYLHVGRIHRDKNIVTRNSKCIHACSRAANFSLVYPNGERTDTEIFSELVAIRVSRQSSLYPKHLRDADTCTDEIVSQTRNRKFAIKMFTKLKIETAVCHAEEKCGNRGRFDISFSSFSKSVSIFQAKNLDERILPSRSSFYRTILLS